MKATGIIRRIDELGRVVIPKEIRRSLNIKDNDPLEIFIENDCVVFQKYCSDRTSKLIDELSIFIEDYYLMDGVPEELINEVYKLSSMLKKFNN